jgi:hypothetical protein
MRQFGIYSFSDEAIEKAKTMTREKWCKLFNYEIPIEILNEIEFKKDEKAEK